MNWNGFVPAICVFLGWDIIATPYKNAEQTTIVVSSVQDPSPTSGVYFIYLVNQAVYWAVIITCSSFK